MRCRRCGAENREGAAFCASCGAGQAVYCPACGAEQRAQARFCDACGVRLEPAAHDPLTAALERLAPREYAERLLAAPGRPACERRQATLLFSDIQGSTALAERLDPEEVLDIINGAFEFLIAPVYRYGGTLARLMGDAILAFFGAPVAHEDDPERACRAALEIIAGAREYAARLERERGMRGFGVRVGIHTGPVVVGEVGSDRRGEYTAVGDAVNVAARLEGLAEPGTIVLSEETRRLVAWLFETESLGQLPIRGRAAAVTAHRLLGVRASAGKERGLPGVESPLVGREAELRELAAALAGLGAGEGSIVTVEGEAGLGKSRLVAELREMVRRGDGRQAAGAPQEDDSPDVTWGDGAPGAAQWVEGRCLSYETGSAYRLWTGVLRSLVGAGEEDAPATLAARLRERLEALCPAERDALYPCLARLLALPLAPEGGVEGPALRAATFAAVETLLERTAAGRGLVLVCEDLHWADPISLELLQQVAGLAGRAAVLLVCTYRPQPGTAWAGVEEVAARACPGRHRALRLAPLSAGESEVLAASLLAAAGLPAGLKARVLERAQGNPFYMEEIVRSLLDAAGAAGTGQAAVPDTLQGLLMARIDSLPEATRRTLQTAAVVGRTFTPRLLAAAAGRPRSLTQHLRALQREGMLCALPGSPEPHYTFRHHLLQEAAYNSLLKRDRATSHRRVAVALERLFPERDEELAGLLAYHWERAGEGAKAVEWLLRAGDRARLLYAHQEAAGYYERALALLEAEADSSRAARTLMKLGLTYHTAFDYERARAAFDRAFALWQEAPATPRPTAPHALRLICRGLFTLDPQMAADFGSMEVAGQLFRGLVELTPEMDVVPDAAERWEVLQGGRKYLFHLRDDLCWSDGAPLTAADFCFAWQRALDPAVASPNARLLYDLKNGRAFSEGRLADAEQLGVRALDAHTLAVELEAPTGYLLTLVAHPATHAVPRHVVRARGDAWAAPEGLVTSGPFRVEAWRPGELVALSASPNYRGRARGNVQRVELRFLPGAAEGQEWALYQAGELDMLTLVPPAGMDRIRQRHAGELVSAPALYTWYVAFATAQAPLADVRVRRALAMAVDRARLPDVVKGFMPPATGGFVPPGLPGHSPGIALRFDVERARGLLAAAGYADGRRLTLRLLTMPCEAEAAAELARQWREHLGVEVAWEATDDYTTMVESQLGGRSQLILVAWVADYTDPDNFLRVGLPQALTGWHNERFEQWVQAAGRSLDQDERMALYRRADRLLVEQAALLPLYYGRVFLLVKPWLRTPCLPTCQLVWKDAIIEPHD